MTPFERKDMPWIIGGGIAILVIIMLIVAFNA